MGYESVSRRWRDVRQALGRSRAGREEAVAVFGPGPQARRIARPRFAEHDRDSYAALLALCEELATERFAPHYRRSDTEEPSFDGERVHLIPEIAEALDNEKMIELNAKVDIDGEKEADVAQEFLREEGFID